MLRQRDKHNAALNNQYQQQLPLKVGHREEQVAKLAADSRERRALEERIKMAELMAGSEYMEKKKPLEFENLRIQLAAEVAKSKAPVKILDAPSEVPDDAQASVKSETSYLDLLQTSKEVKGKSQKE